MHLISLVFVVLVHCHPFAFAFIKVEGCKLAVVEVYKRVIEELEELNRQAVKALVAGATLVECKRVVKAVVARDLKVA